MTARAFAMTVALMALVALLAVAKSARADQGSKILLIEDLDTRRIGARLRAELSALGFDVEETDSVEPPTRESLEDAARAAGAVAALRVRASRAGVEVWVMDRVTSKTLLREVVLEKGEDLALVAVRAVELLRASLLEIDTPSFTPGEVPPPPAVGRLAARPSLPSQRVSLIVAPAIALSPGGLSPTAHVDLRLHWRPADRFVLVTRLILPTLPASVEAAEGRATVSFFSASLGGDALLLPAESAIGARVGVGAGFLWAHMEGTAAPTFVGRGDDVFAALSFAHAGASLALGRSLRLVGDGLVGVAMPRPVVSFADHEVASWGRPLLFLSVGFEIAMF